MQIDWELVKTLCRGPVGPLAAYTMSRRDGNEFWLFCGMLVCSLNREGHKKHAAELEKFARVRNFARSRAIVARFVPAPN